MTDRKTAAVEDSPSLSVQPIRIDPKDIQLPAIRPEKVKRPYWCGCLPESGHSLITIAGEDFPSVTEEVVHDEFTNETRRARRPGVVKMLSEEQVAEIKRKVVRSIIRFTDTEEGRRGRLYTYDDERLTPFPTDEPLAKYVYLIPADTLSLAEYQRSPAEFTMLARNGAGG